MDANLAQMFFRQAARFGKRRALLVRRAGRFETISWRTFAQQVEESAYGLLELGIQKGDRVAILSENRAEWALADLATLAVGAADVPIYATNTAKEVEYILADSGAVLAFVSTAEQLEKIKPSRERLPSLKTLVLFDRPQGLLDPGVMDLDELKARGSRRRALSPGSLSERLRQTDLSDLASILYTSGTTGPPKGVMLTHGNFLSNVSAASRVVPIGPRDVSLSVLPLSHSFERTAGHYLALISGATIGYAESIDTVTRDLAAVRPTVMAAVPRFYEKTFARIQETFRALPPWKRRVVDWALRVGDAFARRKQAALSVPPALAVKRALADLLVFRKIKRRLGGRIRFFISGGAPLARELAEFFYACGVLILEGYGLTETSPVVTVNRFDRFKFGTVGLPIEGVEVKLAPDGEILVRGPNIMKGYFHRDAETREVLSGGWFHTGDIGIFDADGFLAITDRKKDLIVTAGGKNVAPQNLENLFKSDPLISEAMVYGDRMPYLVALIAPNWEALEGELKGRGIESADRKRLAGDPRVVALLWRRLSERQKDLSSYQQIKKIAVLPEALTQAGGDLTPTLKLRRKIVSEKFKPLIDSLYHERA